MGSESLETIVLVVIGTMEVGGAETIGCGAGLGILTVALGTMGFGCGGTWILAVSFLGAPGFTASAPGAGDAGGSGASRAVMAAPGGRIPMLGFAPRVGGLGAIEAGGDDGVLESGFIVGAGGGVIALVIPESGSATDTRVVSFLGVSEPLSTAPIRTVSRLAAPASIGFGGSVMRTVSFLGTMGMAGGVERSSSSGINRN